MEERAGDSGQYVDGMWMPLQTQVCENLVPCSSAISLGGYRTFRRWGPIVRSESLGMGLEVWGLAAICFLFPVPPSVGGEESQQHTPTITEMPAAGPSLQTVSQNKPLLPHVLFVLYLAKATEKY